MPGARWPSRASWICSDCPTPARVPWPWGWPSTRTRPRSCWSPAASPRPRSGSSSGWRSSKPSREDASVGVDFDSVVGDERALREAARRVLRTFKQPALVERFIPGREVYVSLLGNAPRSALPLSEIRFGDTFAGRPHIVSYRAKWEPSSPECIDSPSVPCTLPSGLEGRVVETALAAFEALGCRD